MSCGGVVAVCEDDLGRGGGVDDAGEHGRGGREDEFCGVN